MQFIDRFHSNLFIHNLSLPGYRFQILTLGTLRKRGGQEDAEVNRKISIQIESRLAEPQ